MSLKKVSRWSEHEQVTQTEEGRLRRRVQRGMLKPHLVTKRWKWRESHQKSTSWVLTYPAVIWSEKRQRGTWNHLTVPFLYENNVCFGLKVKPGTSYSKLSVNLLEAAASYYQLVTEDWLWGNGLLAILHDCNLNFSQNFFTPLQVFSFVSLSLDKMKHNLYSCYSGNILSPKIHLSSNDKWVNGRINSTQRSNREPLEARLSHCPSVVITGDFLL